MKKMFRLMAFLAVAVMLLAACTPAATQTPGATATQGATPTAAVQATPVPYENRPAVKIAALKGPTGLGLLNLMQANDNKTTQNRYTVDLYAAPTDIVGLVSSGSVDIAAVPTNLAATLYAKTKGDVQLLALNTLGVLYVLEAGNSVNSIADLAGKTIAATGQASTPEYALNYILKQKGVENVTVEYYVDHSELAAKVTTGEVALALLPQPFVTTVLSKNANVRIAVDLNEAWADATGGASLLSMGSLIVRKGFAEENKAAVDAFLAEYAESVKSANEKVDETAALSAKYGIIPSEELAKQAIPKCSIVFIAGEEMAEKTGDFLQVLFDADPKSVGGALPDAAFYYKK